MSGGEGHLFSDPATIFGSIAHAYAAARPRYPPALFDWLVASCAKWDRAWDCAAGNGQASSGLTPRFEQVCASDVSFAQIRQACRASNVFLSVGRAEVSQFAGGVFDLVVVAQALHWFDLPRFWSEVRRVARPGWRPVLRLGLCRAQDPARDRGDADRTFP